MKFSRIPRWVPSAYSTDDGTNAADAADTDDTAAADTWWLLGYQNWPNVGPGCQSTDRSVQLTFRMLGR